MAFILNIDTSTTVCSVVLARDGVEVACKESNEGSNHSILLGSYIDDILTENGVTAAQLDAVAISMGPGSYTGLRIGVSMAKGICFAAGKPLIAVPTLQALALSVSSGRDEDAYYCPMLDARRMEVYVALFDRDNHIIEDTRAEIIDENSFVSVLASHQVYFFGNGSDKVKTVLSGASASYLPGVLTSASNMISIAERKFEMRQFEDVAYFEPFYLKDFIATVPKNKVL